MREAVEIRAATLADLSMLVRHRRLMFESMGFLDEARNDAVDASVVEYLQEAIPSGRYRAWVALRDGVAAGTAGLRVIDLPGSPRNVGGRYSYLMSVYVEPEYRRKGIATRLVDTAIEWSREQGIVEVRLHASDQGRPVYERLGFRPTNEMRLMLESS